MSMKINREKVYQKCNGKCGYCGEKITIKEMQIDHIVPIYRNCSEKELSKMNIIRGTNDYENLIPACKSCNKYKSTFTVEVFREQMQKQVQRLIDYSVNYRFAKKFNLVVETNKKVVFYFETI